MKNIMKTFVLVMVVVLMILPQVQVQRALVKTC